MLVINVVVKVLNYLLVFAMSFQHMKFDCN
jgi:tRNA(Ile)-lysidine synthase TilS/MesJ